MNATTLHGAPITNEELLARLNWRYATKRFDQSRKIDPETWNTLEDALRLTASSGGLQPWKFVVVTDPAVREKLVGASHGQPQVRDASHLVVFTAKKNFGEGEVDAYLRKMAAVRGVTVESLSALRGMLVGSVVHSMDDAKRTAWAARQTYIALGALLTSAALLGVDAAPMEGFIPAQYDEILGLAEKNLTATVICGLGFRHETDPYAQLPKVRFEKDELFIHV